MPSLYDLECCTCGKALGTVDSPESDDKYRVYCPVCDVRRETDAYAEGADDASAAVHCAVDNLSQALVGKDAADITASDSVNHPKTIPALLGLLDSLVEMERGK